MKATPIHIGCIGSNLTMEVGHGESWISFQFEDDNGTVRNASITPYAVFQLDKAAHDLTDGLLTPLIDAPKMVRTTVEYPEEEL